MSLDFKPNSNKEREQLLFLAIGIGAIGTALTLLTDLRPYFLFGVAAFAGIGVLIKGEVRRCIFLLFSFIASILSQIVSRTVIFLVYFGCIAPFGIILKLFGMNKLDRNFSKCKKKTTMFSPPPTTGINDFKRQS